MCIRDRIGAANNKITKCINSLSIEYDRNPEVSIKKDGMNKQCNAHTSDKDPANLSVVSCVLIIFFQ